jgi:acyl-coenzyme A synthetase/AMP-(fatty) acid ligase
VIAFINLRGLEAANFTPKAREDEMPRTATGKILHRVLRSRLSGG